MTTCCYDGTTLAADSRSTGIYIEDCFQKIFTVNGAHIAIAGTYSDALLFIRWFKDQTKPKPDFSDKIDKENGFDAIVIRQGKAYTYDSNCIEMPSIVPCAIGSGCQFAMGAMYYGATAKEAVNIAKKLDESTGGKVRTVTIK